MQFAFRDAFLLQRFSRPGGIHDNAVRQCAFHAPVIPIARAGGLPVQTKLRGGFIELRYDLLLNGTRINLLHHSKPAVIARKFEKPACRVTEGMQDRKVSFSISSQLADSLLLKPL